MKPVKTSESVFKNAEFIWIRSMDNVLNAYVDFHESLTKKEGAAYRLFIIADSNYALWVNGKYCEGFQFAGLPEKYNVFDEYDITDFLTEGENDILIAAYAQNEGSFGYSKGTNGVMYVITENGEPVITSGLHTKANKNPHYTSGPVTPISPQISFTFDYNFEAKPVEEGEVFVSRKFDTLYPRPVAKHKILPPCKTTPVVWGSFVDKNPDEHPGRRMQLSYLGFSGRLRFGENKTDNGGILLNRETDTDGIYIIYDMGGEEEIGYLTVDITLPEDAEFMLGWGEHIDDLRVRTSTCTWNNSCYAASFKGKKGRNTFMHPFKRLGGRYISLQVYAPEAEIHYVGVTPTVYPTAHDVKFTCADNLHNTIYEVAKRSMLLCFLDRHSCDTLREQGNYGLDTRIYAMGTHYAFREFPMAKNSIRLFSMTLRGDNMLEMCAPGDTDLCIPTYTCSFMELVWEYLLYSGDYDFAREMVPVADKICSGLLERTDERGLIERFHSTDEYNYWNFHEWNTGLDGGHDFFYSLPTNAFASIAYQSLAKTYDALGEKEKAEKWFAAADALNKVCHKEFYNEEEGCYYTKIGENEEDKFGKPHFLSQFAQSLAIYAGMCPENELDHAIEQLVYNEEMVPSQLSFSIYRYDAMMMRPEKYARVMFKEIADRYGYMLRKDSATFWETFRGGDDFEYAANMVQGWSGVPAYLYLRYAAGIVPTAPGVFEKHPLPSELTGIYEINVEDSII